MGFLDFTEKNAARLASASSILGIASGAASLYISLDTWNDPSNEDILNKLDEMDSKLDQILTEFQVVELQLDTISRMITQLESQLDIDTKKIQSYVEQVGISDAISSIQTHFGTSPLVGLQWFLQTTSKTEDGITVTYPVATEQNIEDYAKSVLGIWDISKAVTTISNGLLGKNVGSSEGLLRDWSTLFITQMGTQGHSPNLKNYCRQLENYFFQQLFNQINGMYIITNALCPNANSEEGCPNGTDYLLNTFGPMVRDQVELYLQCVEKMVLSQFKLTLNDKQQLVLPADAEYVLARADLAASLILNNFSIEETPGLRGRTFASPDNAAGKGVPLSPGFDLNSQSGKLVEVGSGYGVPRWSDEEFYNLRDIRESDIAVNRYYWEWPDPAPQPGDQIFITDETSAKAQLYDTDTLDVATESSKEVSLFAPFIDYSYLLEKIKPSGTAHWKFGEEYQKGETSNKYIDKEMTGPKFESGKVMGAYHVSQGQGQGVDKETYGVDLCRSFKYQGQSPIVLGFSLKGLISLDADVKYDSSPYHNSGSVTQTPYLTILNEVNPSENYNSNDEGITINGIKEGDKGKVTSLDNKFNYSGQLKVKPGEEFNLTISLLVKLMEHHAFPDAQRSGVEIKVNYLYFTFELPALTPA